MENSTLILEVNLTPDTLRKTAVNLNLIADAFDQTESVKVETEVAPIAPIVPAPLAAPAKPLGIPATPPPPLAATTSISPPSLTAVTPSGDIDARGLPWDARIHARTKSKDTNGSWKRKRGVSHDELTLVETELMGGVGLANEIASPAEIPEIPLNSAIPPVATAPIPPAAPAPLAPVATAPILPAAAAPLVPPAPSNVVTAAGPAMPATYGFSDVVGAITAWVNTGLITRDELQPILNAHSLTNIGSLMGKPEEVISAFFIEAKGLVCNTPH